MKFNELTEKAKKLAIGKIALIAIDDMLTLEIAGHQILDDKQNYIDMREWIKKELLGL